MEKVDLRFLRISYSHTHAGAYALILVEVNGERRLPIIIGAMEAQAIAITVEKITPARPLTHDLFTTVSESFGIKLREVVISDLVEGIFHAKLVLEQDGKEVEVDARSSDAVALALRFGCPIHTYEFILAEAGLQMTEGEESMADDDPTAPKAGSKPGAVSSMEELRNMLEDALDNEDYELASKLRDEIKRREQTN